LTPPSVVTNSPDSKKQSPLKLCHPILEAGKRTTEKSNESSVLSWTNHQEQYDSAYFDDQKELTEDVSHITVNAIIFKISKQNGIYVLTHMNNVCHKIDDYNFFYKLLLRKINFINKENAEICATEELEAQNQVRFDALKQNDTEQSDNTDNIINWNPKYNKVESIYFNNESLLSLKIDYINYTGTIFKIQQSNGKYIIENPEVHSSSDYFKKLQKTQDKLDYINQFKFDEFGKISTLVVNERNNPTKPEFRKTRNQSPDFKKLPKKSEFSNNQSKRQNYSNNYRNRSQSPKPHYQTQNHQYDKTKNNQSPNLKNKKFNKHNKVVNLVTAIDPVILPKLDPSKLATNKQTNQTFARWREAAHQRVVTKFALCANTPILGLPRGNSTIPEGCVSLNTFTNRSEEDIHIVINLENETYVGILFFGHFQPTSVLNNESISMQVIVNTEVENRLNDATNCIMPNNLELIGLNQDQDMGTTTYFKNFNHPNYLSQLTMGFKQRCGKQTPVGVYFLGIYLSEQTLRERGVDFDTLYQSYLAFENYRNKVKMTELGWPATYIHQAFYQTINPWPKLYKSDQTIQCGRLNGKIQDYIYRPEIITADNNDNSDDDDRTLNRKYGQKYMNTPMATLGHLTEPYNFVNIERLGLTEPTFIVYNTHSHEALGMIFGNKVFYGNKILENQFNVDLAQVKQIFEIYEEEVEQKYSDHIAYVRHVHEKIFNLHYFYNNEDELQLWVKHNVLNAINQENCERPKSQRVPTAIQTFKTTFKRIQENFPENITSEMFPANHYYMINQLNPVTCQQFLINSLKNSVSREIRDPIIKLSDKVTSHNHKPPQSILSMSKSSDVVENMRYQVEAFTSKYSSPEDHTLEHLDLTQRPKLEQTTEYVSQCKQLNQSLPQSESYMSENDTSSLSSAEQVHPTNNFTRAKTSFSNKTSPTTEQECPTTGNHISELEQYRETAYNDKRYSHNNTEKENQSIFNTQCHIHKNQISNNLFPDSDNITTKAKCYQISIDSQKASDFVIRTANYQFLRAKIMINGSKELLWAIIDTGAEINIIAESKIHHFKAKWEPSATQVQGIGTPSRGGLKEAHVDLTVEGRRMQPILLHAIPDELLGESIILGRTFLAENGLAVDHLNRKLFHYKNEVDGDPNDFHYSIYLSGKDTDRSVAYTIQDCPVYVTEDLQCIENESIKVGIKLEDCKDAAFPTPSNFANHYETQYILEAVPELQGLYPVEGIINLKHTQEINFMCTTDNKIKKGDKIGYVTSVLHDPNEIDDYQPFAEPFDLPHETNIPPPDRLKNVSMEDTDPALKCNPRSRLYPPINMENWKVDRDMELKNNYDDSHPNKFTKERIMNEADVDKSRLTTDQLDRFYNVLFYHQQAFNRDDTDISLGLVGETNLEPKVDCPAECRTKPRRIPRDMNRVIFDTIKSQKQMGLLEPGSGPYSSSVHVVYKAKDPRKKGKSRLVVDYRDINAKCIMTNSKYLTGCMNMLQTIKSTAQYFTTIDLKSAFYSVGLTPECRDLTAINVDNELLRYTALPFGLSVSSQIFNTFIEKIFEKEISLSELICYIDDILSAEVNFDAALKMIEHILQKIISHRLKINLSKCKFLQKELPFLGFIVGVNGISKNPEYCERIKNLRKPVTGKNMQVFIGSINYIRNFIPGCSKICGPLIRSVNYKNTKQKIDWTPQLTECYEQCLEVLREDVRLGFPDTSNDAKPFLLYTDASIYGLGAVLYQEIHGEYRTIAYVSRTLIDREMKRTPLDLEIMGVCFGVSKFDYLLTTTKKFYIFTDCTAVGHIFSMKFLNARLARMLEVLGPYTFSIINCAGENNWMADALSRQQTFPKSKMQEALMEADNEQYYIPPNYEVREIPGGPQSLIHSILTASQRILENAPENMAQLRKKLVTELINHPDKYNLDDDKETKQKTKLMLSSTVLPYIEVCQAMANLYKCKIVVYFGTHFPIEYLPQGNIKLVNESQPIVLLSTGLGCHYNVLTPKNLKADTTIAHAYTICSAYGPETELTENGKDLKMEICIAASETNFNLTKFKEKIPKIVEVYKQAVLDPNLSSMTRFKSSIEIRLPADMGVHACALGHFKSDLMIKDHNDNHYCILMDGAATFSMVTYAFIQELTKMGLVYNLQLTDHKPIYGIGKGQITPMGRAYIKFPLTNNIETIPVTICETKDLTHCMLLGGNVMTSLGLIIEYMSNKKCRQYKDKTLTIVNADGDDEYPIYYTHQMETRAAEYSANPKAFNASVNIARDSDVFDEDDLLTSDDTNFMRFPLDPEHVQQLQTKDNTLCTIKNSKQHLTSYEALPEHIKLLYSKYSYDKISLNPRDDILYANKFQAFVLPPSVALDIIFKYHTEIGHVGMEKLYNLVQDKIWCLEMRQIVNTICRTCPTCLTCKTFTSIKTPPIHSRREKFQPFDFVSIDILSLPKSHGYSCVLTIVDQASGFLQAYPLRGQSASQIIPSLKMYLSSILQCPKIIFTDNQKVFIGNEIEDFLTNRGIIHMYSPSFKASCNGHAERLNQIILQQLRLLPIDSEESWVSALHRIVILHNFTKAKDRDHAPANYIYETAFLKREHFDNLLPRTMQNHWRIGNPNFHPYEQGDLVLNKTHFVGNMLSDKCKPRYQGIYKVVEQQSAGLIYNLINILDNVPLNNKHYTDLRPFQTPYHTLLIEDPDLKKIFLPLYEQLFKSVFNTDVPAAVRGMGTVGNDANVLGLPPGSELVTAVPPPVLTQPPTQLPSLPQPQIPPQTQRLTLDQMQRSHPKPIQQLPVAKPQSQNPQKKQRLTSDEMQRLYPDLLRQQPTPRRSPRLQPNQAQVQTADKQLPEKVRFSSIQEMEEAVLGINAETATQSSSSDTFAQSNTSTMPPAAYELLKRYKQKTKEAEEIERQKQEIWDQMETYSLSSKPTTASDQGYAPTNDSLTPVPPITDSTVTQSTAGSEEINRFPIHQTRTPKAFKVNKFGKRSIADTASERSYNSDSSHDTYRRANPYRGVSLLQYQNYDSEYSTTPTPSPSEYSLAPSQDSLFAVSDLASPNSQDLGSLEEGSDQEKQRQAYGRNQRDQNEEQNRQQLGNTLTREEYQRNYIQKEMEKLELEMSQLRKRQVGLKEEYYKQTLRKETAEKQEAEKQQIERQQHEKQVRRQELENREVAFQRQNKAEREMYEWHQQKKIELRNKEAEWAEYTIAHNQKIEREEIEARKLEKLRNQQVNMAGLETRNYVTMDLNRIANETMDHIIWDLESSAGRGDTLSPIPRYDPNQTARDYSWPQTETPDLISFESPPPSPPLDKRPDIARKAPSSPRQTFTKSKSEKPQEKYTPTISVIEELAETNSENSISSNSLIWESYPDCANSNSSEAELFEIDDTGYNCVVDSPEESYVTGNKVNVNSGAEDERSSPKLEVWETQHEARIGPVQASQRFFDDFRHSTTATAYPYDVSNIKTKTETINQTLMVTPIKRELEGADMTSRSPRFSTPLYDDDRKQSCTEQFELTDKIDKIIKKLDNVYTPPMRAYYDPNHSLASAKMESDSTNRSIHSHKRKQNEQQKLANRSFDLRDRDFEYKTNPRLSSSAPPILGIKKDKQILHIGETQAIAARPTPDYTLTDIQNRQYTLQEKHQRIKTLLCRSLIGNITPEQQIEWKEMFTPTSIPTEGRIPPLPLNFEGFETTQSDLSSSQDDDLNREINESVNAHPLTGGHLLRPDRHQHYGK
jgi:hypothetical protein